MGDFTPGLIDHIIVILLTIVLPVISLRRGEVKLEDNWSTRDKTIFYFSNSAVLWVGSIIILLLWYFCDRSFAGLGFQSPLFNNFTIFFTLLFVAVYIGSIIVDFLTEKGLKRVKENWKDRSDFMPVNLKEFLPFTFLSFTAGVTEEIIFRGYLMNYILALSPGHGYLKVILAMLIPALVFGLIHMYQGIQAVQKIVIGGLIFGAIYYYSQSLVLVMLIHFLVDVITGYLLMKNVHEMPEEGVVGS